jgi:hypothetical protein
MATLEELISELETLTPQSLDEMARFIQYLKWKQGEAPAGGTTWVFDLVDNFRRATVSAEHDPAGMEVKVGEAACSGELRMALWQHPPLRGSVVVEYQVPVPANVRDLRLEFATGIRDGSHLAEGNIVAFRLFINGWKLWSDTQHQIAWKEHEITMPALAGDVTRIQFITDGLGNHEWAWAVWGEPRLSGKIVG